MIKIIFHQSLSKSSLTFSLPSQPISLFLSSLLRLYYQPLVILSRTFSNCEIGLSLLIVVVVFLTTVGSFRISVLMLGFTIMCTNGAFKVQKDLFLDDQEPANSGLFSFLGSVASFATARGRPTPPIRLRPTSLLPIRPTSLPPIRPIRPKPQAVDPRLRPVLHLNTNPMSTSLGFFGFRGFHSSIQALGFIIEATTAFLRLLLWFSINPSFGYIL